jgi:hypothetical protein
METSYHSAKQSVERDLFDQFAMGVAYISVVSPEQKHGIGTCFHIGDHVFITARHVVEGQTITKIATTNVGTKATPGGYNIATYTAGEASSIDGPFYHPNPQYDLAALRVRGFHAPQIPFLPVLEDPFDNKLLLRSVVIMGFPPIPGSKSPVLVCATAQVNGSFESYFDSQRVYVVSCLARGGFSGGPALTEPHHCLGMVTSSLLKGDQPEELGFMAVVPPLPILELLDHHSMMPPYLRNEVWEPYCKTRKKSR